MIDLKKLTADLDRLNQEDKIHGYEICDHKTMDRIKFLAVCFDERHHVWHHYRIHLSYADMINQDIDLLRAYEIYSQRTGKASHRRNRLWASEERLVKVLGYSPDGI